MSMPRILDVQGRPLALAGELARGGEGAVYDIVGSPNNVAKVYLQPPSKAKSEKIAVMVGMATDRLTALSAWPTAPLLSPGGALVGFIMPKLSGHRPVFQVYGPKLRLKQFPKADWRFLVHAASNVARAFGVMHASGLVVGDVNHGNLFVAEDATVRFIDADSMQVAYGGRVWKCEVGTPTHQPPEMQALASYRDVIRTPNHDAFGLAVMIFQLLCVGRHPFSGRYSGPGEPPDIEQAIKASRYAYSTDTNRTRMSSPPGSLTMSALPPPIRDLFEAAFAPAAQNGGRPPAERWTSELTALAKSLLKCRVNAGHWHSPISSSCPWCALESQTATVIFPAVFVTGRSAAGGIALLWQEIQAVRDPGPLPSLNWPDAAAAQPTAWVRATGRRLHFRPLLSVAVFLVGILIVLAFDPPEKRPLPIIAVVGLAALTWHLQRPRELGEVRKRLVEAKRLRSEIEKLWLPGPAARFAATRRALDDLKREYDDLPACRAREMQVLLANRRQQQIKAFLEDHELASAQVPGIGRAKVTTLLSYGIETAADIERGRILVIPGFGPKTVANLVAFRALCEAKFRFDPSRAVASAEIAAMDGMLHQRRVKLEADLSTGLAQLKAIVSAEQHHRSALDVKAADARPLYAQALADASALRIRV